MKFNKIWQHLTKFHNIDFVQFRWILLTFAFTFHDFKSLPENFGFVWTVSKLGNFQTWKWQKFKKSISQLPTWNTLKYKTRLKVVVTSKAISAWAKKFETTDNVTTLSWCVIYTFEVFILVYYLLWLYAHPTYKTRVETFLQSNCLAYYANGKIRQYICFITLAARTKCYKTFYNKIYKCS